MAVLKLKLIKFIIIEKGKEKYYHIYFNGNKEEIKRNYINKNNNRLSSSII